LPANPVFSLAKYHWQGSPMSVGLVKPKMSPPKTSGVPFGGSTLAQRSAKLGDLTGALRGKSAATAGTAITRAEKTILATVVMVPPMVGRHDRGG
jgi:hypothetical protein